MDIPDIKSLLELRLIKMVIDNIKSVFQTEGAS